MVYYHNIIRTVPDFGKRDLLKELNLSESQLGTPTSDTNTESNRWSISEKTFSIKTVGSDNITIMVNFAVKMA